MTSQKTPFKVINDRDSLYQVNIDDTVILANGLTVKYKGEYYDGDLGMEHHWFEYEGEYMLLGLKAIYGSHVLMQSDGEDGYEY